jgi:2-dehydropantoate 2-reductase
MIKSDKMHSEIAVIGLGGVGGYFGFKLAQSLHPDSNVNVIFVARHSTFDHVNSHGLRLLSPEHGDSVVKPDRLLSGVEELSAIDLVWICVKEYDLEKVCEQLTEKLTDSSVILPLMNGVDIYDRIRKIVTKGIVLPACVYVASHIKEKGVVEHKGNPGRIIFGNDPSFPHYVPDKVIALFNRAGIVFDYRQDPFQEIWTKFLFIAPFGLVTARYNVPIGKVHEDDDLKAQARVIMQEVLALAHAKGISLPDDAIDRTFQKAATFPYHTPTSLQLDIHAGKQKSELELFAGAIMNYGEQHAVPTPATRRLYEEIKSTTS